MINPRVPSYQIPAIKEADFEDFCLDFFQELWSDDEAQPVGKKGSAQQGVDICGQPNRGKDWYGAQCKNKEILTGKQLSKVEIQKEVEKAKKFTPPIKRLIIATTATRNTTAQETARLISEENQKNDLFDVKVYAWEDIQKKLIDNTPKTLAKWFPQLTIPETFPVEQVSELKRAQIVLTEAENNSGNRVNIIGDNNIVTIGTDNIKNNGKVDVHNAQIDTAKLLIDNYNPEKAIDVLNKLKDEIWTQANDIAKFRIISNLGSAHSQIGKLDEAARFFVEALQYNPNDEKALLNSATGFLLLENKEEAEKKIQQVLDKNPLSGRAWALKLEATDNAQPLTDIVTQIPESLKNNALVNTSLAQLAMVRNELLLAETYLRNAIKQEDKNPDTQTRLAEVLLQQVLDDEMVVFADHINEENTRKAKEAISLFDAAWLAIDKTEMKKYRTSWLINRSIAKRLTGDKEGSFQDIELAAEANPNDVGTIRSKAGLLYDTGKKKEAIEWLESNPSILDEDNSLTFMLAGFLQETKQFKKAAEVLKALLKRPKGETKNHDAKRLLIQVYLDDKDYKNAQETLNLIPNSDDFAVLNLVEQAKINRAQNKSTNAITNLLKAKKLLNKETSRRQKIELANGLYSFEQYSDAADVFKELIAGAEDDDITKRYLNSLYRAGRYSETLDFAEQLRTKVGLTKYLVQLETAIYDEIGDPEKSENLCTEYLLQNPDDKDIKIRLAIIKLRLRKEEEIEPILSTIKNIDGIDFPQLTQLVNIYREIEKPEIAIDLAYELRRKFYANPDAHLFYVNVFLNTEKPNEELLGRVKVAKDTYVELNNAMSKPLAYILEERKDPDIRTGEITPSDDIYNELIDKNIGDKVAINPTSGEGLVIKDIKSKYVFAFQESMQNYNTHFPKAQGMVGFTFDSSTPETTEASIQMMLKQVTALSDSIAPVEKAYRDGKITVGIFAELIKKNPIDVFYGLMSQSETPIRAALGTKEEIEASARLIKASEKTKLIIDITSIISMHELGLADKVVAGFGKLGITQSTIDLINENLSEKKGIKLKGFATIGKNGSNFYREEITPEQIEKSINYFEGIIRWIESNCERVAAEKIPSKISGGKEGTENILGKSFTDTLSIVIKKDYVLFTDDERFRSYLKSEYGIDGVWSQLVLSDLAQRSFITQDEYIDAVIRLVSLNFTHTAINKEVVFRAGKKAKWDTTKQPFAKILSQLGEGYANPVSSILVTADFLSSLWTDKEIDTQKRDEVAQLVIKIMIDKRDKIKTQILATLQVTIDKLPASINARIKEEIKDFINKFSIDSTNISV